MKVGIIGCGVIGKKRARAVGSQDSIIGCFDIVESAKNTFSEEFVCIPYTDHKSLLSNLSCEAIVVAVVNKYAKDIVLEALRCGKHVLVEKPLGRNVDEAKGIIDYRTTKAQQQVLKVGFNHRFHPALSKAKALVEQGAIGRILTIRARYGHGGRPGMEGEWRASKDLCGGGELLDQGVHIIDLIRWFGGEIREVYGKTETKSWNIEVEDNAFALLKTERDVTAQFHVSWTNWRNIFSFEVFGENGYVAVNGLGGSYGVETLEVGKRKKESGRPDIDITEYSGYDASWVSEWQEFRSAILEGRQPLGSGEDGLQANKVVEALYESSRSKKVIWLS